jgi:hypothetical protein
MLSSPSALRNFVGRLAVIAALAAALPLTATRAINYVDVPRTKESSQSQRLMPLTLRRNSMASRASAAPAFRTEPERANSRRDPSSGTANVQAEREEIWHEDEPRARRDEADARTDVQLALRDEEQRRRDMEQAHSDEQQARMDANRTLEESEPAPD